MATVYFYRFKEFSEAEITEALALVSKERQEKINRLKSHEKKCEVLAAGLLLRAVLCRMSGVENGQLEFSKLSNGKLILKGFFDICFSISHTTGSVALVVSDREVGIDVEYVRPVNVRISEKSMLPNEIEYIDDGENTYQRFMTVWTRKEAFVKKTGQGYGQGFKTFSVFGDEADAVFDTVYDGRYFISTAGAKGFTFIGSERSSEIVDRFIMENLKL